MMMKKILLPFFLCIAITFAKSGNRDAIITRYQSLQQFLESNRLAMNSARQQLEKTCPGFESKFKIAMTSFKNCEENFDDTLTICQMLQSATLNCSEPVVKVITDCLPEKARDLPILSIKSFVSVAGYLCSILGESIFELANPCLWDEFDEGSKVDCEDSLLTFLSEHKEELPSASEICTAAAKLRVCVQQHGGLSKCKNQKTKDAAIGFADAVLAPCSQINELE